MINRLITWLRTSAGYLWLVVVAVYLSILAGQAVTRNYQSKQDTAQLEEKVAELKQQRDELQALVVYYNTDSFKEKELRRALLLKQKDEKVYALPESSESLVKEEQKPADKNTIARSLPIWQQWLQYLWNGRQS